MVGRMCTVWRWFGVCLGVTGFLGILLWISAPQQIQVVHYKLVLSLLAGVCGYWLDRVLFPFAAPASYLRRRWKETLDVHRDDDADYPIALGYQISFCVAMFRQVCLVVGTMLSVAIGL